jgi:tRNA(fMet)-specific endonuclease VapC
MGKRMEVKKVLLDTSILIDFYRKKNVKNTVFYKLFNDYNFCISVISEFELIIGFPDDKIQYALDILNNLEIENLNSEIIKEARIIYFELKKINKLLPIADIFIAATAKYLNIPLVTLNKKHFAYIERIILL